MKTLKKRLSEGIASVYLVEGDDFYLFDKALSMIKNACKITVDEFNISFFDDENYSLEKLYNATEMLPIGDLKRLIVLKNVTIKDAEKKNMESLLLKIPKSTCVVILDYNKSFEYLKRSFTFVDASRLDKSTVQKLVKAILSKQNKQISDEALDELINSTNGFLTKIVLELQKIVCFDTQNDVIGKSAIEQLVNKDTEYSVFQLTEALSNKDGNKALKILKLVEKEPGIFTLITNHFRRLFYSSISDQSNSELASLMGVKEYAIVKARQLARGFSKSQLKKINSILEELDYLVKCGKMQISNALYLLVFDIIYI